MDLFGQIKGIDCVTRISNLYELSGLPTFVYFLCPKMNGQGLKLNELKTGLTATYTSGLSDSAMSRLERAEVFVNSIGKMGIAHKSIAIWSDADALILFPLPVDLPPKLSLDGTASKVLCNYGAAKQNFELFADLYRRKPWRQVPQKWVIQEEERLRALLPSHVPTNVVEDFIRRIFAGFALDGILLSDGYFGPNPVIIGVESKGITVLQNSALPRDKWIPVVEVS